MPASRFATYKIGLDKLVGIKKSREEARYVDGKDSIGFWAIFYDNANSLKDIDLRWREYMPADFVRISNEELDEAIKVYLGHGEWQRVDGKIKSLANDISREDRNLVSGWISNTNKSTIRIFMKKSERGNDVSFLIEELKN